MKKRIDVKSLCALTVIWGYTMFDNGSDKVNQKRKLEKSTKKLSKYR